MIYHLPSLFLSPLFQLQPWQIYLFIYLFIYYGIPLKLLCLKYEAGVPLIHQQYSVVGLMFVINSQCDSKKKIIQSTWKTPVSQLL
jgi:hypothetical protein